MIKNLFQPPSVERIEADALAEAQRSLAQHRQAFEYHAAMIGMYEMRIARL